MAEVSEGHLARRALEIARLSRVDGFGEEDDVLAVRSS